MEIRKYTYKLYPSSKQENILMEHLRLHQQLYNAALQERIEAYRKQGLSITYSDQQASLTKIRAEHPEYKALLCSSERMTLRRLDKAFRSFFSRVKKGQPAGFPRFKSLSRFSSFEFLKPNFSHNENGKHGRLFIKGVGHIKARGKCRIQGEIKTSQVKHQYGTWWLSLTVEGEASRKANNTKACGIDWGVKHLLTIVEQDGSYSHIKNPRYYKAEKYKQEKLQKTLSSKERGSNQWKRSCKALSEFKRKQAERRKDEHHKLSAKIASQYALITMEKLAIKNISRSAKGTKEKPGKNVKQKAGLNREILDTTPSRLMSMIRYKVEETGGEFLVSPTIKLKPSQRCPKCGYAHKDNRKTQANFTCIQCDFSQNADVVSGINSLLWVLGLGQEHAPEDYSLKPLLSTA